MKRVKNSDIKFKINKKLVYLPNFTIRFYTVNQKEYFFEKTQDDLVEYEREATVDDVEVILSGGTTVTEYYLPLNWSELLFVGQGILNYKLTNNIEDPEFPDYQYNKEEVVTTDFYIDSIKVDPEPDESLIERVVHLEEHLAEEIVNREEADAAISGAVDSEIARAVSAETALQEAIDDEIERAISAETLIVDALEEEANRAISAETALDAKIDQEIADRIADVNAEEARAINAESALTDTINAEANRAISAETALDTKIDAEANRATSAETALQTAINDEATARANADTALQTAITNEESRAREAESGITNALNAEVTRATGAENALDTKIDVETTRATGAEAALDVKIDTVSGNVISETTRATTAENALSGAIDSISAATSGSVEELDAKIDQEIADRTADVDAEETRAKGVEDVLSGAIDTIDAKFIDDAKYEMSGQTHVINFYNGSTIKATIDCTDFLVDGMIDNVYIENGYLVIDFNTASGKQDIRIPLTDIFNPANYYTKSETSGATEIANALDLKLNIADFNTYSAATDTLISSKASQSTVDALNGVVTAHTADTSIHVTSNDKEKWNKVDDKADTTALTAVNDTLTAHTADTSIHLTSGDVQSQIDNSIDVVNQVIENNEEVTAQALNVLNGELANKLDVSAYTPVDLSNYYQKSETSGATELSTAFAATQPKLSAGTGISIDANNVISATGGGGGGTVESAITSGSTNAVESKAIWSAVTYDVSINETLEFDNTYAATNYPSGCNSVTFESNTGGALPTGDYVFTSGGSEVAKLTCSVISWWPYEVDWTTSNPKLTYASEGNSAVTASYSELAGDIDGVTVPSAFTSAYTATASGENHLWINENTYRKYEVYNKSEINVLSGIVDTKLDAKLDATAYTPTVVDSSLNMISTNPVQNKTLYDELRIDNGGGETETTLAFEVGYSTNYPNGCTRLIVGVVGSNNYSTIYFYDNDNTLGSISISNFGGIFISNTFDGATYTISDTTVIISYPTVTNVTKIQTDNGNYVYKAVTTGASTALKDQVVANTASIAANTAALATKQNQLTPGSGISIDANNVISVTGGTGGGISSAECQTMIDQSISGKTNQSDFTGHTADTTIHVTAQDKTNWNNKSNFSGDYNDLTNKPTIPTVPTNVSDFTNDAGYITSNDISGKTNQSDFTAHTANTTVHVTSAEKATWNAKSDFSGSYNDLTDKPTIPTVPTSNTAFTNDAGYITANDITGKTDVTAFTAHTGDTTAHVTSAEKATWNAKSDFSGSYNDLTNKLSAGTNITIVDNVISATGGGGGGSYTAGRGIDITSDVISVSLPISAGTGNYSIIEGGSTSATSECAHAEGWYTKASGARSHAEGYGTVADNDNAHVEGYYTIANNNSEHACGKYNVSRLGPDGSYTTLFSVGNGTAENARHNAFEIRGNGDIYFEKNGSDVKLQDVIPTTTSAVTSGSTAVLTSGGAYEQFGGLKLQQISQSDYENLPTKDSSTLYIIL